MKMTKSGEVIIGLLVCVVIFGSIVAVSSASNDRQNESVEKSEEDIFEDKNIVTTMSHRKVGENDKYSVLAKDLNSSLFCEDGGNILEIDSSIPTVILRESSKGNGFSAIARDLYNNVVYFEENIQLDGIDALEYVYEQIYVH